MKHEHYTIAFYKKRRLGGSGEAFRERVGGTKKPWSKFGAVIQQFCQSTMPFPMRRPRGQSKPLSVSQSQHIDKKLRTRARHDLALYTTGLDTMLRNFFRAAEPRHPRPLDLLRLKVRDVLNSRGQIIEQLTWWQKKNKRNVKLTLTPETQAALKQWIEFSGKQPDDYLFTRHKALMIAVNSVVTIVLIRFFQMIGIKVLATAAPLLTLV